MMRLVLSVVREIIHWTVFVALPVTMTTMEHPLTEEPTIKITFDKG